MSVIDQVYQETRRLAVAGSNLAADDFRLKKLVPLLRKASEKAPIFGRLADASEELLASKSATSADKLLELSSMVTAIRYTQGQTGIEGKLQPLPKSDLELKPTRTGARVLKPLLDALSTTGSGRLEIIRDAYERGLFNDLRLVTPALRAIDDSYYEIADYVADTVLPTYGPTIYAQLESGFDLQGAGGAARRLKRMHAIDPTRTRSLVEKSLESGSQEVKLIAIECLRGDNNAIDLLLLQTKSKSKAVRLAALRSLSEIDKPQVIEALVHAMGGNDSGELSAHIGKNPSKKLKSYVLAELHKQLDELLIAEKPKQREQSMTSLLQLLPAIRGASDKETVAFLARSYNERSRLEKLKGLSLDSSHYLEAIGMLIAQCGNKPLQKRLIDDVANADPPLFAAGFRIAIAYQSPAEAFERFSPYYTGDIKKTRNAKITEKRDAIRNILSSIASPYSYGPYFEMPYTSVEWEDSGLTNIKLDDRWLDVAVQKKDHELIMELARPDHKPTQDFLAASFQKTISQKSWHYKIDEILQTMFKTRDPNAVPCLIAVLQKINSGSTQSHWWLERLLAQAPPEAAEPIEALLPSLNERLVDTIVPYLTDMKART